MFRQRKILYWLLIFTSCIFYLIGHFSSLSPLYKVIYGVMNISAIFFMIFRVYSFNFYRNICIERVCKYLICYSIIHIFIAFFIDPSRYKSFIFSPFYLLTFLIPLFTVLTEDVKFLHRFFKTYLIISFIGLLAFRGWGLTSMLIALFFPLIKNNKRTWIIVIPTLFWDLVYGFNILGNLNETTRITIIEMMISFIAIIVGWIYGSRKITKIIVIFFCSFPIILWVLMICYDISVFEIGTSYTTDRFLATDNRTSLYMEMLASIENFYDLLFGQGLIGGYYSEYFDNMGYNGPNGREAIEVTMLHILLKGGLLLLLPQLYIMLLALKSGLKYGMNRLVLTCCILLSGHITCMCIGDYPSRTLFSQILPFVCVGICSNKYYLQMSDNDIIDEMS